MIAVRLQGGLGNQLFQYAAGRALADRPGRDLGLDLRDFARQERRQRLAGLPWVGPALARRLDTPRPYLLDRYAIRASVFSWWGAWMGTRPGKRVVAPKAWFKTGAPTPDLCPQDWVRL